MKRDWDVIKKILEIAEERPYAACNLKTFESKLKEKLDSTILEGHLRMMMSGGLFESINPNPTRDLLKWSFCLTWKGYDFLDSIRNESIWSKVKTTLNEKALTVPFDVLSAMLKSQITKSLGLNG